MTARFVLPQGLLSGSAIRAAVERQCRARPDLLPPDPADAAVIAMNRYNAVAKSLTAAASEGLRVSPRDAVAAHKGPLATRPVLPLSFPERALLDALLAELNEQLQDDDLTDDPTAVPFDALQRRPIETEAAWVVGADVNSFYQYISHQLLTDQLVSRTGDWNVANALRELLGFLMGTRVGLPQGFRPMRALGDVYLAQCVRALRRAGYLAWAHSDDLRIGCSSRRDAHDSVLVLDEALRSVGLSLNTEKCWVRSLDSYTTWSNRPSELLAEFATQYELDVDPWLLAGPYDEGEESDDEEGPSEDQIRGTVRQIFEWAEEKEPSPRGAEGWSHRYVITEALRSGARYEEPSGLTALPAILQEFPQLTDDACQYLRAVAPHDEEQASKAVRLLCHRSRALSPWQLAWLAWGSLAMGDAPKPLLDRASNVLEAGLRDVPWAWCAALLVREGRIAPVALARDLGRVESAVARDVVIAALAASTLDLKQSLVESAHERAILAASEETS